jgi:uncharacterized membrane protein YhaH (DUF805 family)
MDGDNIVIEIFKKYSDFNRRATRSEYWGVLLSVFGLSLVSVIVSVILMVGGAFGVVLGIVLLLATMVLSTWVDIATIVARCRDAGINPWFTLACFIPYLGTIAIIVFGCLKTEE